MAYESTYSHGGITTLEMFSIVVMSWRDHHFLACTDKFDFILGYQGFGSGGD
jgi:hypothetical protein